MDVTILKLDLEDAQFNAPFAGSEEDEPDEEESSGTAGGSGFDLRPIAVIATLAGLAALAAYLRSGDGVEVEVDDEGIEIEEA